MVFPNVCAKCFAVEIFAPDDNGNRCCGLERLPVSEQNEMLSFRFCYAMSRASKNGLSTVKINTAAACSSAVEVCAGH